ncbi:MAG: carbohydrate ABC transporter permease [Gaiellaceae bacterium MAG52_C11]|nr:carbohydrate ABC transporter permease [Candidatus Gaiellasilicea maunaloa]
MAVDVASTSAIPRRPLSYRARRLLVYVLLVLVSALFFVPFLWTISTALKSLPETTGFDLVPDNPSLRAFREVLTDFNFARFALNSFILAGAITVANLVLASLGGYAFARLRFPGREVLFMLVLATLMIPDQLRLVPVFQMLTNWGLVGSFFGFIAIHLVLPTELFLMRQYFLTIPKDFEEAAKLDNAGFLKTYWKVMLPLAAPALAAVTILTFQGMWNDFFWSLIILGFGDPDVYTIQLGLAQFRFQYQTLWPQLMAASALAILPIALIYVFFQRYFVAGVVASGVKG